jgi:uncharacterized protein (TIGR04255 family)
MMAERNYPKAPITEALVDLRVGFTQAVSLEELKEFGGRVHERYPHEGTRDILQGQFDFGSPTPKTQSSRITMGYIFHSADRRQAVQARLDGFTFSRFAPYQDWRQLIDEARKLWNIFIALLKPATVSRVAVRYVNQINLPLREGSLSFEHYLRTFPGTSLEENVSLEQFFMRLVMPQDDLAAKLVLTEALLPEQAGLLPVILDIDLFRENLALNVQSDEVWGILETFRARKNKYFEASITDATRELFA